MSDPTYALFAERGMGAGRTSSTVAAMAKRGTQDPVGLMDVHDDPGVGLSAK